MPRECPEECEFSDAEIEEINASGKTLSKWKRDRINEHKEDEANMED